MFSGRSNINCKLFHHKVYIIFSREYWFHIFLSLSFSNWGQCYLFHKRRGLTVAMMFSVNRIDRFEMCSFPYFQGISNVAIFVKFLYWRDKRYYKKSESRKAMHIFLCLCLNYFTDNLGIIDSSFRLWKISIVYGE